MGGVILTNDIEYSDGNLLQFLRHTGPALSPFNAWILLKGLETLELRMAQHCKNAREIARFLTTQSGLSEVIYPGLKSHPQYKLCKKQMSDAGSMVCFKVEGGIKRAFKIMNAFKLINISNNLGDAKTLATHPASTTHQRLSQKERNEVGITDSLVRLSIGLEDVEDIKEDLEQAVSA